ncbi:NAD(P)-dependent alcohol dehydrogenase [Microbacterium sp. NPDC076911]|uniref:NAD(P)-dependent alcohol dehydrogenase n=1 Tax=Microbacterium sp. NPDC076911 TaxID=3154958 RepID=UPI0034350B14
MNSLPTTMSAWCQQQYGGPGVVTRAQVDVPNVGRDEVLLRIHATSLNAGDIYVMRGEPLILRAAFGFRRPKEPVRGMDAAATVVAVGERVTQFSVGDEVVGEAPGGAFAEYAVSPASRLVHRPAELDVIVAAALPLAGGTAWQALDRAGVSAGQRVLVIGASGGVGTFAVQLSAQRGAEVWALCGERNRPLVESLGATTTFDYKKVQPGATELGEAEFDVVIDIAGTTKLRALQRLVRDGGKVVLVSGEGGRLVGPLARLAAASILSVGSKRKLLPLAAVANQDTLNSLVALAVAGSLAPPIERVWSFEEVDAALAHADNGHTVGKTVVTVAG